MRTSNPTLKAFEGSQTWDDFHGSPSARGADARGARPNTMTIAGTANAAMILVGICAAAGIGTWMFLEANAAMMFPVLFVGCIVSLILSLVISFKPPTAPVLAPVYAVTKGAFLGSVSLMVATYFVPPIEGHPGAQTGIIFQAIVLTFGILFSLLAAFRAGLVRIGETMKMCMLAALGGVFLLFIVGLLINLIGGYGTFPMFHEMFGFGQAGLIGIGFSVFMVVLASLFLVWDFQIIETGVKSGAPKYMEWYGGFALLVTLAWLYFEALRLLSKLRAMAGD